MANDLTPILPPGGPPEPPTEADVLRFRADTRDAADGQLPTAPPWHRYLNAVLRHKWAIIAITICGTAAGIFLTRFVQLKYVVQTTLWVEVENQSGPESGPIRNGQLLESTAWVDLLNSPSVLEHVVRQRRLFVTPASPADAALFDSLELDEKVRSSAYTLKVNERGDEFVLSKADGVEIQRGRPGDPVGASVGLRWTPPATALRANRTVEFSVRSPHDVARWLGGQLQPELPEKGSFLKISLEGTDPVAITATLNAVATRYVQVAAELKASKLVDLTRVLDEQLRYAERNLHEAEIALESFRVQTVTLPSEQASPVAAGLSMTRDPVFANYFDLKVRREQLREDREAMERILGEARSSSAALDGLTMLTPVTDGSALKQALNQRTTKRAELRTMQQRYTDEFTPVRTLADEIRALEERTIPQLAADVIASLRSEESLMDERIGSASTELREIPPRAIEEARLQRQVTVAGDLHTDLKQRYEVARLAAAGSIPDIRVLDPAVEPSAPTGDTRRLLVVAGFMGSLGLAVLGVILLDRIDSRMR